MSGLVLVMGVMVALAAIARETECKALCLDQEPPTYEVEEDDQGARWAVPSSIAAAPPFACADDEKRGRDGLCHKAFFVQPLPGASPSPGKSWPPAVPLKYQ